MRQRLSIAAALVASLVLVAPAAASATQRVPATWRAGVNLTDWTRDGYAHADAALRAAHGDGATDVSLVPTLYVDDAGDSSISADPARTPSDDSLKAAAAAAEGLGLTVTMKPHVDALDGSYRGDLDPSDRAAWFRSYAGWLDHYARLAQQVGAHTLVIGTELDSMAGDQAQFARLIAIARADFHGELTYAANWNDVAAVGFWDQLDVIGVDAYVPLGGAGSSDAELRAAWTPLVQQLGALHAATGKPVVFTELGYQSRADALESPYDATGAADDAVQARGYETAFAVWSRVPWFRGISWWDWPARPGAASAQDGDFSPQGKAAEAVMARWSGGRVGGARGAGGESGLRLGLLLIAVLLAGALVTRRLVVRRRRTDRGAPAAELDYPARTPCLVAGPQAEALLLRARLTLDSQAAVLFLRDPHDPRVVHVAMGVGVPQDLIGRELSSDEGLMGHVLTTGNAIAVSDRSQLPSAIHHPLVPDAVAALSVPLRLGGRVIGALTVSRDEPYAPSERHLLCPLADELAKLLPPWIVGASWPGETSPGIAGSLWKIAR